MSYTKITTSFKDHETVLTAAHLQHMENGIADNDAALVNRVRTDVNNQGLSVAQKSNARMNIDAPSTAEMTAAVAAEADLRSAADAAMETKTDGIQGEVDQAKEDITDLQSVSSSMFKTKTVTGNHLTIKDALTGKAKKLVVSLKPKQEMNGYVKPWVGRAGKNLLPLRITTGTKSGVAYAANTDGTVSFTGTQNTADTIDIYTNTANGDNNRASSVRLSAGTYNFSGITGGSSSTYRLYVTIYETTIRYVGINEGSGSFSLSAETDVALFIRFFKNVTVNNLLLAPMICLASESPEFEPYENICPISGYDTVEVASTGKNMLDTASWAIKSGATNLYLKLLPKTKYTMSSDVPNSSVAGGGLLYIVNSTGNPSYSTNAVYSGKSITVETNDDGVVRIVFYAREYITDWSAWQIQLELGPTATDYEPFNGQNLAFPVNAITGSTIYGGTLTLNEDGSGEIIAERASVTLDGSEAWTAYGDQGCYMTKSDIQKSAGRYVIEDVITCDRLQVYDSNYNTNFREALYAITGWANSSSHGNYIYIKAGKASYSDAAEITSWLASNPVRIAYRLASPLTYPVTAEQIRTLLGKNHIWTDGTEITLTYCVDKYGNADKLLSAFPVRTVGPDDMVAIDDGADDVPIKELSIAIKPEQNLNGYDKPWIGGAGKNLCPTMEPTNQNNSSFGSIVTTINRDGSVTLNGTTANGARHYALSPSVTVTAGTAYVLSGCPSGGGRRRPLRL